MNIKDLKFPSTLLGLTALGMVAVASPAEAIPFVYSFTGGNLSDGGTLSGDFTYNSTGGTGDPTTAAPGDMYLNWNITVSGGSNNPAILPNLTYTPANSVVLRATDATNPIAGATNNLSQSFLLRLNSDQLQPNQLFREIALGFGTRSGFLNQTANYMSLPTTDGGTTTLMRSSDIITGTSLEQTFYSNTGTATQRGLTAGITVTASPVPWETDILPFVGATTLFAGGLWWKRRRRQDGTEIDFLADSSELSNQAESN